MMFLSFVGGFVMGILGCVVFEYRVLKNRDFKAIFLNIGVV